MKTDTRYEDLMARRTALFAEWMKRVEAAKRFGDPTFYGTGVVLLKDGTLRMSAYDRSTGQGLWDLTIEPFSTEIKERQG
jgi:hypothetical protein